MFIVQSQIKSPRQPGIRYRSHSGIAAASTAAAPDTFHAWLNELVDSRAAADEAAAEPGGAVAALDQAAEGRKLGRKRQKKEKTKSSLEALENDAKRAEAELRRVTVERAWKRMRERDGRADQAKKDKEAAAVKEREPNSDL